MTAVIEETVVLTPSCDQCGWHPMGTDNRSAAETQAAAHDREWHPDQEDEDA
jgi:hypothetical protein